MADGRVHINRLHGISARGVDDVMDLRQLDEIAEIFLVAAATPLVHAGDIRGRAHLCKDDIVAAKADVVFRIAGVPLFTGFMYADRAAPIKGRPSRPLIRQNRDRGLSSSLSVTVACRNWLSSIPALIRD